MSFWTILGLLGALTGLGTVGAAFVLGIPAFIMLGNVLNFFGAIVKFFKSPLGQIIGAVLVLILVFEAGATHGSRQEIAKCQAAAEAARVQATLRDAAIHELAAKLALQKTEALTQENQDLNQKVADYEKELATRKAAPCSLNNDDVKRLRGIIR